MKEVGGSEISQLGDRKLQSATRLDLPPPGIPVSPSKSPFLSPGGDILRPPSVEGTLLISCQGKAILQPRDSRGGLCSFFEGARAMKPVIYVSLAALVSLLICVPTNSAQTSKVFVDDQHRFSIQVAAGWVAKPFNSGGVSGVPIAHGNDAYVQIFVQKGIDPASFLKALNSGIQPNHPGYRISNRGTRSVAGEPRLFIVGDSPETPTAPHTSVYLETFAANGFSFAIIASSSGKNAPGKDKPPDYEVSQGMIQSLSLNGEPGPSTAAEGAVPANRPAPAVAAATVPEKAPTDLPSDDQKKLAALDAALKGGAISEEEYKTKKSALQSSNRAQQDRANLLKALDQAYSDGVLTKDEYERKKNDLVGGLPSSQASAPPVPPAPSPTTSAPPTPQPTAVSSAPQN